MSIAQDPFVRLARSWVGCVQASVEYEVADLRDGPPISVGSISIWA
jgi:hypothetical protein